MWLSQSHRFDTDGEVPFAAPLPFSIAHHHTYTFLTTELAIEILLLFCFCFAGFVCPDDAVVTSALTGAGLHAWFCLRFPPQELEILQLGLRMYFTVQVFFLRRGNLSKYGTPCVRSCLKRRSVQK